MTKYLLVGGYISKGSNGGRDFCEELVEGFDQPVRILDCLFARPPETWDEAFEGDKVFFGLNIRDRKVILTKADPATFTEQVRKSDAILFRGGTTQLMLDLLKQSPEWTKELDGKTLAGTSAGVDMFAAHYWDLDDLQLHDGLGLVPVKTLVHYRSDYNASNINWDKALAQLKEYGDTDVEILALAEGEFVVRYA